jgi:hypothetical protein
MALTFVRPALLAVNGTKLSDHNRSELGIDVERIETKHRMANGTMRKYVVADKRTFTVSWEQLPTITSQTVDGFMGAAALETFYNTTPGAFTLTVANKDGSTTPYTVMFTDFTKNVVKRWATYELWNVNITMEEV